MTQRSSIQKLKKMLDDAFSDIGRHLDQAPGLMFDLTDLNRSLDEVDKEMDDMESRIHQLESSQRPSDLIDRLADIETRLSKLEAGNNE